MNYSSSPMANFILIALLSISIRRYSCFGAEVVRPKATIDGWLNLHESIFRGPPEGDEPIKVRERLEQLAIDYNSLVQQGLADSELEQEGAIVGSIYELGFVSEQKCDSDSWSNMMNVNTVVVLGRSKVIPYADHYLREQFIVCKPFITKLLETNLRLLSQSERQNIEFLVETIKDKPDQEQEKRAKKFKIYEEHMGSYYFLSALMKVIDFKEGPLKDEAILNKKTGYHNFHVKFENVVGHPCGKVLKALKEPVSILDQFSDSFFTKEFDPLYSKWLLAVEICKEIKNDYQYYIDKTYGMVRFSYPKKQKVAGPFMCFGSKG